MGEDKSLLPFENYNTLIEYQYNKLIKLFPKVYISCKYDKFDFLTDEEKKEILIYDVCEDESSPMIALKSIFNCLNSDKIFIITVDTPFVRDETIQELITKSNNFDITIPYTEKLHNLCGVYNKNILSLITNFIQKNTHKIGLLFKDSKVNKIQFFDETEFLNINTKDDYSKAISNIS